MLTAPCIQFRAVNLFLGDRAVQEELVRCTIGQDPADQLRYRFASFAKACRTPGKLCQVGSISVGAESYAKAAIGACPPIFAGE